MSLGFFTHCLISTWSIRLDLQRAEQHHLFVFSLNKPTCSQQFQSNTLFVKVSKNFLPSCSWFALCALKKNQHVYNPVFVSRKHTKWLRSWWGATSAGVLKGGRRQFVWDKYEQSLCRTANSTFKTPPHTEGAAGPGRNGPLWLRCRVSDKNILPAAEFKPATLSIMGCRSPHLVSCSRTFGHARPRPPTRAVENAIDENKKQHHNRQRSH